MFTVLVCSDLWGQKENLEVVFPTAPSLAELIAQIEAVFAYEAQRLCPPTVRPNTGDVHFRVTRLQIYDDALMRWTDLSSPSQLHDFDQIYAFHRSSVNNLDTQRDLPPPRPPALARHQALPNTPMPVPPPQPPHPQQQPAQIHYSTSYGAPGPSTDRFTTTYQNPPPLLPSASQGVYGGGYGATPMTTSNNTNNTISAPPNSVSHFTPTPTAVHHQDPSHALNSASYRNISELTVSPFNTMPGPSHSYATSRPDMIAAPSLPGSGAGNLPQVAKETDKCRALFEYMDRGRSNTLNLAHFTDGLTSLNIRFSADACRDLFTTSSKGKGYMSYGDFTEWASFYPNLVETCSHRITDRLREQQLREGLRQCQQLQQTQRQRMEELTKELDGVRQEIAMLDHRCKEGEDRLREMGHHRGALEQQEQLLLDKELRLVAQREELRKSELDFKETVRGLDRVVESWGSPRRTRPT